MHRGPLAADGSPGADGKRAATATRTPVAADMTPPRRALASITSATPWGRRPGMK